MANLFHTGRAFGAMGPLEIGRGGVLGVTRRDGSKAKRGEISLCARRPLRGSESGRRSRPAPCAMTVVGVEKEVETAFGKEMKFETE